jgi:hypothetical protein
MLQSINTQQGSHALEFGLYRDGDNNLDETQEKTVRQAQAVSSRNSNIEFTIEDTTAGYGVVNTDRLHTEEYTIDNGRESNIVTENPHDMSSRADLTHFVAHTLDNAEKIHASQTWIDLVDHGGGDGGGLQSDHGATGLMRADDIAGAIADGIALHAKEHPEDNDRRVDGVVANQCLMATLGFASSLSHAGVHYLAASPETMLAPGVPSGVAQDIAKHLDDPQATARAVVNHTMRSEYGGPGGFAPSAAFDVLDLSPEKIAAVERTVKALDTALTQAAQNHNERAAIREDARTVHGMVRFPEGKNLPWRADRPAIALYETFAQDERLEKSVRNAAEQAVDAISTTILAHRESSDFAPFHDADYRDAVGPTVHFPITHGQIDTWAPAVSETDNAFYKNVGGNNLARVVA